MENGKYGEVSRSPVRRALTGRSLGCHLQAERAILSFREWLNGYELFEVGGIYSAERLVSEITNRK